ncbi:MAG: metallophosphoesterase [Candidatus Jettenia sp.]|uniref:Calcineurin-like phosphoesterase domain-containing protein n=1 Tax=Candidatus Jettenia caeni TaxID=247490 RepID=I3IJ04_9BACT|nr:metallophosphoesterase [Candidatus Jettenia sp. AMX1]MBC6927434.1 metallophosphoesterase [Candidatus Jettenia sp.]NUN23313.1 metallophosphoesterase [Candidatus Jettenia caeni]KAA0249722.1 MAG: metallophosphoesterase [Candidatus Jettenia sp. AMX1]MCE7879117.1 metallophosphoesterase [Candidatus Jettenia sp. AMX1]MCQ3925764.1 metallophosphoesterase [Candidatus Jettenia sp.]
MISRRTFMQSAFGHIVVTASLGGYSRLLEPRWVEINAITIKINALPKRFEGMTIAQLSDIHHGKYVPREFIRRCVRKVNALAPDIIVLTGDYIHNSDNFLLPVTKELAELQAKEGIFAVVGNHDNKGSAFDTLRKEGIHVLINRHIPLYRKKDYIFIAGIDDLWEGKVNLEATLKGMDNKPKILLSHNPDIMEMIQYRDIDFVIAGHTHGGQVNLPFYGSLVTSSKFCIRYASGLFREGKTIMYVNKGIGTSCLPIRFCARPEITLFTLRNSSQIV